MAESFGDRDMSAGGPGKRPAPTIEGTATEIVEPAKDDKPSGDAKADASTAEPNAGAAETAKQAKLGAKAPPPPPRTSGAELKSFMTHLAAGLLGGLIGVLGLTLARGYLPANQTAAAKMDLSGVESRLAKLEAAPVPQNDPSALDDRVKALESRAPATAPDLTDLTDRVSRLEESMKALAETAKEGGSVADAAAINNRIVAAEQKLAAKIDSVLAERETANGQALETANTEIADLKAKFAGLADPAIAGDVKTLSDRLGTVEAAVSGMSGAIEKDASEAKAANAQLALANLRAAVNEGRLYRAELSSIRSLAPGLGSLGVLPAFADQGIPTIATLTSSFETAREASAAATPAPAEESFLGSLVSSARSMVKVKRIDEGATGDDADAILARAEAKLKKGELAEAVQEVDSLSGSQRDAFAAWLDQARARASADDTLRRLESDLAEIENQSDAQTETR